MLKVIGACVVAGIIAMGVTKALELIRNRADKPQGDKE
ncbi:hypothetical protein EV128_125131 [Rhizobium azibense]|nr:hypothetical protein EV128_125131 [Rhizobium azibense]